MTDAINLSKVAIKKAELFIKTLKGKGISVQKAYLFGSHAKGLADMNSDIDVCVVSNSFGEDYMKEMVDLRKISLGIDSRIEPIPFSMDDLDDPFSTLASEIKNNSIGLTV